MSGSRVDYDGWDAVGNAGWSAGELLPLFAAARKQLRMRRVGFERVREVAQAPELRRLLGRETRPGPEVVRRQAGHRGTAAAHDGLQPGQRFEKCDR